MSTDHARGCLDDAEAALAEANYLPHAAEQHMLRAYSLARSALLRLDPREAPDLVARASTVLERCGLIAAACTGSRGILPPGETASPTYRLQLQALAVQLAWGNAKPGDELIRWSPGRAYDAWTFRDAETRAAFEMHAERIAPFIGIGSGT